MFCLHLDRSDYTWSIIHLEQAESLLLFVPLVTDYRQDHNLDVILYVLLFLVTFWVNTEKKKLISLTEDYSNLFYYCVAIKDYAVPHHVMLCCAFSLLLSCNSLLCNVGLCCTLLLCSAVL